MVSGWARSNSGAPQSAREAEAHDSELLRRFTTVFRVMLAVAILSYGSYIVLFLILGVPQLPIYNAIATVVSGLAWWVCERGYLRVATFMMGVVVLGHIAPATLVLGWKANFHLFAFLFLTFALLSPQFHAAAKIVTGVLITAGYLTLQHWAHGRAALVPDRIVTLFDVLNTVMFACTISGLAFVYSTAIWKATEKVQKLNASLERLATIDALTGLLNRRSIGDLIDRELVRFARSGRSFSVVIGDLDDFKIINDEHGHSAGDSVLCAVADALREALREGDRVGRWGGEEFVLLLPETNAEAARLVAERIQSLVRAIKISNAGVTLSIRMTFGVAESVPEQSADELLVAADSALYEGKRNGKDCVVLAA